MINLMASPSRKTEIMKPFLTVCLLILFTNITTAQSLDQVLPTTAGQFSVTWGVLDFTVGEFSTGTLDAMGMLEQGFLHHYEAHISTASYYQPDLSINFALWPNPTRDHLHLETDLTGSYAVKIHDFSGRLVLEQIFVNNTVTIDLQHLAPQNYSVGIWSMGALRAQHNLIILQ